MSNRDSAYVRTVRQRRGRAHGRVLLAALTVVVVLLGVSILLGSYTVTVPDFLRILGGEQLPGASFIVLENKLPRAVTALLTGAAFGLSGTLFQTMLRNPLASPDIIGISYGASAAAVSGIVFFSLSGLGLSLAAIVGALVAAAVMTVLAFGDRGNTLILSGIGVAAFMQAGVTFLLQRTDLQTAQDAMLWLVGSLNSASWERVVPLALALLVLIPLGLAANATLNTVALGPDTVAGLGLHRGRSAAWLTVLGVLLAAVATAAVGPLAFVAFMAGPLALRLNQGRPSLPLAALVGAAVVLSADFVGANLLPSAMPVGVVTGALGAPFLLWLLATGSTRSARGARTTNRAPSAPVKELAV